MTASRVTIITAARNREKNRWRPKLHIAPPFGWLNDPNGLCQYQGIYHVFYQFSPFEVKGGLKFWGHCTSRDLLHWTFEGAPMMPDQPEDCHGVYSGSSLTEDGSMYLYYTGNVKEAGAHDFVHTGRRSSTMLAVSRDGRTLESKEVLMENKDYPSDLTCHVRDPKVWKQEGSYYMIQGARTKEDKGVALLFSSEDKKRWEFLRRFETEEAFGYMWECPDLYELNGRTVLSISPQGVRAEGLKYANLYQSVTCFLEGDFRTGASLGAFRELDGGFDFYAPQVFRDEAGRWILFGWMAVPDSGYEEPTLEDGWVHALTIPRELYVNEAGLLCQRPLKELEKMRGEKVQGRLEEGLERETSPCFELKILMEEGAGAFELHLREAVVLSYEDGVLSLDMTGCGSGRTVRSLKVEKLWKLQIFSDTSSLEIFVNDGVDVFTSRIYDSMEDLEIRMDAGKLRGTWEYYPI